MISYLLATAHYDCWSRVWYSAMEPRWHEESSE